MPRGYEVARIAVKDAKRLRAARGEDLSPFVPQAVANYIARHGLYR